MPPHIIFPFIIAFLVGSEWYFIVVLICISLMSNDAEHLLSSYWPFVYLIWKNVCTNTLLFLNWVVFFLLLHYKHFLHILDARLLAE
jgi:hypothetical protein